jgi:hypothetical protein
MLTRIALPAQAVPSQAMPPPAVPTFRVPTLPVFTMSVPMQSVLARSVPAQAMPTQAAPTLLVTPPSPSVPPEPVTPVDPKTLETILNTFDRIVGKYMFEPNQPKLPAQAMDALKIVKAECHDLRRKPQCFTDIIAYQAFFEAVDKKCHQIIELIRLQKARRKMDEEMANLRTDENYRTHRPSYVNELMVQPWQQFLHAEAPGWPRALSSSQDVRSHQIIPNGGMRILASWEKDVKEIYDFLDAVHHYVPKV